MESARGNTAGAGRRPIVVDFLATLFVTFCIGVLASLALVGSVLLMAGAAHGEERCAGTAEESAGRETLLADVDELALAHRLASRYASLAASGAAGLPAAASAPGCERRDCDAASKLPRVVQRGKDPAFRAKSL